MILGDFYISDIEHAGILSAGAKSQYAAIIEVERLRSETRWAAYYCSSCWELKPTATFDEKMNQTYKMLLYILVSWVLTNGEDESVFWIINDEFIWRGKFWDEITQDLIQLSPSLPTMKNFYETIM